jgi:hypothetical protein
MKRLREGDLGYSETAADRIGDLLKFSDYWHNRAETAKADCERIISEWAEVSQKNYQRAKAAEAKLAKAVEALREIEADCDAYYPPSHGAIKYAIRTALAKLEGGE